MPNWTPEQEVGAVKLAAALAMGFVILVLLAAIVTGTR